MNLIDIVALNNTYKHFIYISSSPFSLDRMQKSRLQPILAPFKKGLHLLFQMATPFCTQGYTFLCKWCSPKIWMIYYKKIVRIIINRTNHPYFICKNKQNRDEKFF